MSQITDYGAYIKSPPWQRTAKKIKEMRGYVCKRCDYAGWDVEVHHLTYERLGHELLSDLEVLCKPCHEKADKERAVVNQASNEDRRLDAAYETYMGKKYGDDWSDDDSSETREEFEEWREKKQDRDYYEG